MAAPYPIRYVVLDTETSRQFADEEEKVQVHRFRLGVARIHDAMAHGDGTDRTVRFTEPAGFHQAIAAMPLLTEPIAVFAHNMAFDAKIVDWVRALGKGLYTLKAPPSVKNAVQLQNPLFITSSPPFIVRTWRPDGQRVYWLDSYQWLPKSLELIGEWLGYKKGERPDWDLPDDVWFDYCERDVLVLDRALQTLWGFLKRRHLGDFQFTPSMQAMTLWRTRYERKRIIRPDDPELFRLDRIGYTGGLFECYRVGHQQGPIYQADCNSLYPHVMRHNPAPVEVIEYDLSGTQRFKPGDIPLAECTAEVFLHSDSHPYPVKCLDGTYQVTGKVRTVLCGPELVRAQARGHIAEIGRYIRYRLDSIFVGYLSTLDKFRMDACLADDKFAKQQCKQLMNNLFGKMGQRSGTWRWMGSEGGPDRYGSGLIMGDGSEDDVEYRYVGGEVFHRVIDREDDGAMVAIAAWCNSYARVYMEEVKDVAGVDHVSHQATDSLLLDRAGFDRLGDAGLLDEFIMGQFKLEHTYEWIDIKNTNYILHDHGRKAAGIPFKAQGLDNDVYQMELWESFDDALNNKRLDRQYIQTVLRRLDAPFRRRRVKAGGITEPFVIDNWAITPEGQKRACLRGRDQGRRQGPGLA